MCCLNCMGYLFNSEVVLGGGEISVDLPQKGGATQKRLRTTAVDLSLSHSTMYLIKARDYNKEVQVPSTFER